MRQKLQQKQAPSLQLRRAIIAGGLLLLMVTPLVLYLVNQPSDSQGQPAGGSGPSGNALDFDGNDDYVSTGFSINFSQSSGNSYTFSAWVKLDATDGSTGQIVCSDDGYFDWSILKAKKNNEWEMFGGNPSSRPSTLSSGVSTDKKWHFITGVFDHNADEARMYVDGILEVTGDLGYGTTDSSIHIGRNPHREFEFFDGKIDEVRIWSEARTQQEIRDLMHQEIKNPGSKTNLEAYYDFNSSSGTTLTDQAGSNDGTLKNMTTSGTNNDWVTSGAALTDNAKLEQGNTFHNDVRGIWPTKTTESSGGLTVSETSSSPLVTQDDVVFGHNGANSQNTNPSNSNYDFSNVSASSLYAVANRQWFIDKNAGGKQVDLTFNTKKAGISGFNTGNKDDYVLIEVKSSGKDELIKTANSVDPSNNIISFTNANINGTYTFGSTSNNSPLPVELTSFTVQQAGKRSARLEWATASETNNKHFLVQRRREDQWQQVGRVKGHGTTIEPQEYGFTDNGLTPGTHYYRLKQVDFDGSYEYSDIKAVTISAEGQQNREVELKLYPNPVSNQLTLEVSGKKEAGRYQLQIRNSSGRLVHRGMLTGSQARVAVSDWQPGAYVLMLKGNGRTYQKRFIKR